MPNADNFAHYGVISLHNVNQEVLNESIREGNTETWGDKFFRHLDAAKSAMDTIWEAYESGDIIKEGSMLGTAGSLEWCHEHADMQGRDDIMEVEEQFDARIYIDQNVMMVTWSKHTTLARPCSPCYPNAGDLDNLDPENGMLTYCLPKEWTNA